MVTHKQPQAEADNSAPLNKPQAAAYLQVTTRTVERAVKDGRICALRPTRGIWRVRRSALDAFLESGATIGGAS